MIDLSGFASLIGATRTQFRLHRLTVSIAIAFMMSACGPNDSTGVEEDFRLNFWVWHRDIPPELSEMQTFERLGVKRLFWHMADYDPASATRAWSARDFHPVTQHPAIVPLIRVAAGPALLERPDGLEPLRRLLPGFAPWSDEIQIDYDCPVRLLPAYARALRSLREAIRPRKLSVTALAGWIDNGNFNDLADSVDGLYPMFYDLSPDPPDAVRAGRFELLCDPLKHAEWIRKWAKCKTHWLAGLPNFTRWSLFGPGGDLKGHLPQWDWDEIIFHPDLELIKSGSEDGVEVFVSRRPTVVAGIRIISGDTLVWRSPQQGALRQMIQEAKLAGAAGIVFFRLPADGSPNAWSVSHLADWESSPVHADNEVPATLKHHGDGGFRLENSGPRDLPPRFPGRDGAGDRGWKLEIESDFPGWVADAAPGEFVRMAAHRDPDISGDAPVHPSRARRLTFWFSALPAGTHLDTGRIWMKNDEDPPVLRWRVDGNPWKTIP